MTVAKLTGDAGGGGHVPTGLHLEKNLFVYSLTGKIRDSPRMPTSGMNSRCETRMSIENERG